MNPKSLISSADRQEVIELAETLIAIESHAEAPQREMEVGRTLASWFRERRIDCDLLPVCGNRANVLARVAGGGEPVLLLNGHLDTVPAGAMHDAFAPRRDGADLWGRGACDMKGALAAMCVSLSVLSRSPSLLGGTLLFAGTVDEESGSLGIRALLDGGVGADGAVVGEPTSLRPAVAHKGSCFVRIELCGRGAHGSVPAEGVNAAAAGARIALAIEETLQPTLRSRTHPLLGHSTVSLGRLCGGTQPNIVAERCELDIDRRVLPGEDGALDELCDLVSSVCDGIEGLSYQITEMPMTAAVPHVPLGTAASDPIAQAAIAACATLDLPAEPVGVTYWTDGGHLAARGIPAIILGPGDIRYAHGPEERVPISELGLAAELYARIAVRFLAGANA